MMTTFPTTGPVDVELDVSIGHVEITAAHRDDVAVAVRPSKPNRSGDISLARDATVTFDSGRLRVRVPKRLNLFGPTDSVDVEVQVPTGSRVAVDSAYGAVRLLGELGATRITAKYGNVAAESVAELVLEAPYGDVDVREVRGRLDVVAGHGRVRIGRIGGDATLRASHGTIDLGTTVGSVDIATSGPVTIDLAGGDVLARSAHGAIRIREVTGGFVRVENGYAEVEVGVPLGVAAWVDAASSHGVVRNELTPDPTAAARDRTVQLRLRVNWADVVIRRASHSTVGVSA